MSAAERDVCANPQCKHRRLVHRRGRCETLNTVTPCRCEEFVEAEETTDGAR